jgi:hypothetical protein
MSASILLDFVWAKKSLTRITPTLVGSSPIPIWAKWLLDNVETLPFDTNSALTSPKPTQEE